METQLTKLLIIIVMPIDKQWKQRWEDHYDRSEGNWDWTGLHIYTVLKFQVSSEIWK